MRPSSAKPSFEVEADKGFYYSTFDEAFVCQKKNHFQITIRSMINDQPVYLKHRNDPVLHKIDKCYLKLYGLKEESPSQTVSSILLNILAQKYLSWIISVFDQRLFRFPSNNMIRTESRQTMNRSNASWFPWKRANSPRSGFTLLTLPTTTIERKIFQIQISVTFCSLSRSRLSLLISRRSPCAVLLLSESSFG